MRGIFCFFVLFGLGLSGAVRRLSSNYCLKPSGSTCDWYPNCLEKKYPCEKSSYPYALTFAYKFCKLYKANKSLFSAKEWSWVSGVRKCLQVALVPVLKQPTKPSCEDIRKKGFASHAPCYLNPGSGVPSICKLGCSAYLKILYVIKSSLLSSFGEVMKGFWTIIKTCGFELCTLIG